MIAIHLHGRMAEFGGPFNLSITTVGEAIRALCVQIKGFRAALEQGAYRVIRGKRRGGFVLDERSLPIHLGAAHELHLVPIARGRGRGGAKAILGVVLIAAAFAIPGAQGIGIAAAMSTSVGALGITFGNIAMMGVSMLFAGISQAISPQAKAPKPFEAADKRPSFLFEQPVNVSAQGSVIPIGYGRFRVGSVVVSASLETEEYSAGQGSVDVPSIGTGKIGILAWGVIK